MSETMGKNLAEEYLDGLLATMRRNVDDGQPFGVNDEGEEMTAWDWLEDVLEIRYLVDSELNYRGAQLLLSYGGPNVWLYTDEQEVAVYWGSDTAKGRIPYQVADVLDEAVSELYEMKKGE